MSKEELKLVVDAVFSFVESKESGLALALTKVVHASVVANLDAILPLIDAKKPQ